MNTNAFMDKSVQPDGCRLALVLGESATFWAAIKYHIMQKHGEFMEEWKFYNTNRHQSRQLKKLSAGSSFQSNLI